MQATSERVIEPGQSAAVEAFDGGIVIAGGGTGGHLIPGLAVARELQARGVGRIIFVGTERGIETRLVPAAGFELRLIDVGGLKNVGFVRTLRTLSAVPRAVLQSRRCLRETRARAVLGIGGYASGPVLLAAALLRIPVVVLEINAKTGLANRLAAPWVHVAAVNFAETAHDFRRAVVTGVPVREAFFRIPQKQAPEPGRPNVLVFGGSQGARAINNTTVDAARIWKANQQRVQLIHQTGVAAYNEVLESYRRAGVDDVQVTPFIEDMAAAMAHADLVVCRAGASTLGELAAAGRPALLVPFPGAADNHQLRNAQVFERAGAAMTLEQAQLNGERLANEVIRLTSSPELGEMAVKARTLARPDAAAAIADLVLAAVRPAVGKR